MLGNAQLASANPKINSKPAPTSIARTCAGKRPDEAARAEPLSTLKIPMTANIPALALTKQLCARLTVAAYRRASSIARFVWIGFLNSASLAAKVNHFLI
jgi:hypothetical protein